VRREDHVLLCNDGLSGKVTASEMCEIVLGASDLAEATNALVQLAVERGGEDNITVLLARFEGDALPQEGGGEDRGGPRELPEALPDLADDPPEEPSGIPSRTVARALLVLLLLLLFGAVLSTWWYLSVHDRRHAEPEEGPMLALRGALLG